MTKTFVLVFGFVMLLLTGMMGTLFLIVDSIDWDGAKIALAGMSVASGLFVGVVATINGLKR